MNSIAVIRFSGELDVARKDEIREGLKVEPGAHSVLLDLGSVSYADSTALAELLRFAVETQQAGQRLAVFIDSPQLQLLIRYAGCQEAFRTFETRAAALTYLGEFP